MQVTVESSEGLQRTIAVSVPAERVDTAVDQRLQELRKSAKINGFRPGKVPMQVVRKRYSGQVRQEVVGELIQSTYQEAIEQVNLRPAGWPSVEPADSDGDDSGEFAYKATFEVYPEVNLAPASELALDRPTADVQDSDVEDMIDTLQKQRTTYEVVEREAQDTDQVMIDFTGFIDGEAFEGGTAEGAPLVLGSNTMIDGFESAIVGLSAGDEKRIQVTFPEAYHNAELAGKPAEFDIRVNEVRAADVPELDDEFVKAFGVESGGLDALKQDIRSNMERELRGSVEQLVKQNVMDGLIEQNEVELPKALVSDEIGRLRQQLIGRMTEHMGGQKPPEGTSFPDDMLTEEAERRVKLGLVIAEIVKSAELKADPDKVRARVEELASAYEDPKQVVDYYYGNPELLQSVEGVVLEQVVTDWVLDQAKVTDEPLAFKDVMERRQQSRAGA
ncbi:MAG: trigger factor [Pseudomonadota bacterium]